LKNKKFDNNNPGLYINIIKHNNIIEEEERRRDNRQQHYITYDNPKSMNPKELDDNLSCNDVLNNHS
jgi:hypothetical protein